MTTAAGSPIVAQLCRERGWAPVRIARMLGVSRQRVHLLFRTVETPAPETVRKIAACLQLPESTLVDGDGRWRRVG